MHTLFKKCDEAIFAREPSDIDQCIAECEELLDKNAYDELDINHLCYVLGNLYSKKSKLTNEVHDGWRCNNYPLSAIKALNFHRKSHDFFISDSNPYYFNETLVNMANQLNYFMRGIEAIKYWDVAICDLTDDLNNRDAPVISAYSKAQYLEFLANYLPDLGHRDFYYYKAYKLYFGLLDNVEKIDHPSLIDSLKKKETLLVNRKQFEENFSKEFELDKSTPNDLYSKDEKKYRKWCLDKKLFLNPLNDVTSGWVADRDILQFPTHIVPINEGPFLSGAFSSLKREYCFARYMLYEGVHNFHPPFENEQLFLADTLDNISYGGDLEKIKMSIRLTFSLFDSLEGLMQYYFLGKNVGDNGFSPRNIRERYKDIDNTFISGLYWLACDLFDNENINKENWKAPFPSYSKLRKLRNFLEHGWLRVSESSTPWDELSTIDYAYKLTRKELTELAFVCILLARSTLLYFTFSVVMHERGKNTHKNTTVSGAVPIYKD